MYLPHQLTHEKKKKLNKNKPLTWGLPLPNSSHQIARVNMIIPTLVQKQLEQATRGTGEDVKNSRPR